MIDSKARQEARAISEGANPRQDIAPKIAYYGLVARALDPGQLPEKLHLSPDFCTFARIEELLMCTLKEAAGAGFSELSKQTRESASQAYGQHRLEARAYPGGLMNATYKRLDGGCGTAAAIEIITLRTIAKQQSRGKTVSLNGLYASARVPLSIAMMHISDLVISKIPTKDNNPYFHYWHAPNAHDSGWTFKDEDVFLDHDKGLRLLELHDGLASNESLEDWGPHLGCPAMLIKGYINKAHRIATDASIEAGLIFPS